MSRRASGRGRTLDVLAQTEDDYDRMYANAALSECGSVAAIPALAAQIDHPKDDVKCSARNALNQLGDASVLPTLLDALTDRSATNCPARDRLALCRGEDRQEV
jgi:HEAT repeat protein